MKKQAFSTLMASAAILGSSMVGCSGVGLDRPKLTAGDAHSLAPRIERLLADKDAAGALELAERMVAADPQNANARAMLGRAYLASGRYVAARTAFGDALTLGNRDPRTIVSLSLVEAGIGNLDGARTLLSSHIADLPAGDYGLAMAMAGDPQEGIRALLEAARAPEASIKTRQNLAYALAMAGAWGQARLIAGQDLNARDAEARIGEWTQLFAQSGPRDRVVAMLGVSPRADDAGMPVQLALRHEPQGDREGIQLAQADVPAEPVTDAPAPTPVQQTSVPAEAAKASFAPNALAEAMAKLPAVAAASADARSGPVPASSSARDGARPAMIAAAFEGAPARAPVSPASDALRSGAAPSRQAVRVAFRQPEPADPTSRNTHWTTGLGAPAPDARASDWVVQLGAFNSEAVAREKWQRITRGRKEMAQYGAIHSVFALNGRSFYRLAIRGFEDRGAAATACAALRGIGQDCFVRLDDTQTTKQARAGALKQVNALAASHNARGSGKKG